MHLRALGCPGADSPRHEVLLLRVGSPPGLLPAGTAPCGGSSRPKPPKPCICPVQFQTQVQTSLSSRHSCPNRILALISLRARRPAFRGGRVGGWHGARPRQGAGHLSGAACSAGRDLPPKLNFNPAHESSTKSTPDGSSTRCSSQSHGFVPVPQTAGSGDWHPQEGRWGTHLGVQWESNGAVLPFPQEGRRVE